MTFIEKLHHAWDLTGSLVCVGLDPKLEKLPSGLRGEAQPFFEFNRALIDATAPYVCAYKPQFAYYAGAGRLDELKATLDYLRTNYPHHIAILDSKRGDIGPTATEYALESFVHYGADAVTVNPYMGGDTLEPFTEYKEKGVIVLCKTSNPGSDELQGLHVEGKPLYQIVAQRAHDSWNRNGNLALVVGATYPEELAAVRSIVGNMPLLVPGIGAQGGDLEATLKAGLTADGTGLLINSSRGIIFAGSGPDFALQAAIEAKKMSLAINGLRKKYSA